MYPETTLPQQSSDSKYLDLLGEQEAIGSHRGQQIFRSSLLPLVYERVWRPIVARVVFSGWGMKADEERQLTMELLDISPTDRVLDVGCGTGNYARHLAASVPDGLVVGIDASETMIASAAKRGGGRTSAI